MESFDEKSCLKIFISVALSTSYTSNDRNENITSRVDNWWFIVTKKINQSSILVLSNAIEALDFGMRLSKWVAVYVSTFKSTSLLKEIWTPVLN